MSNIVKAYAAYSTNAPLRPFEVKRREPGPHDVLINIAYCGVCHSDLHSVNGDWGPVNQPLVPGHEIVGHVEKVGASVKRYKVGDAVGVGCLVDSCRTCAACKDHLEQYCENGIIPTYGGFDKVSGGITQGGYSGKIVVDENFVVKIPKDMPLDKAAPLLCAGITTYSPLRHWNVQKGDQVAVAGLGGLGHVAVKIAAAMGANVTVLSTSESKREEARALGAHNFVSTKNADELKQIRGKFSLILNTISAPHDYALYLDLVERDGTMVLLGLPDPQMIAAFSLVPRRKSLSGSLIGGIQETQEMLDFCAQHGITADIETIQMNQINEAFKRLVKNDVHYRFVIDMKSL